MNTKEFAQKVLDCAKAHEDSFDKEQAQLEHQKQFPNFKSCYKLDLYQACETIDKELRYPLYLLLECCWNDIMDWATEEVNK